jgi:altronate dehydratase small subunit
VRGDAIVLDARDNVATALRDLWKGTRVALSRGDETMKVTLAADIAFGHKFALVAIRAGADVVKYGEAIGGATTDIAAGEHVHVHNVESRRGRGDREA